MARDPDALFHPATATAPVPPWEYHIHTRYSDGSATAGQMVRKAAELGLTRLIFTEHTETGLTSGPDWFVRYVEELERLRLETGMDIRVGLEVPITDFRGGLMLDARMREWLENGRLALILGAVHAYPGHGWNVGTLEPERAIELEFRGCMALAENPLVDAIAHPGGVCNNYATPFPLDRFEEIVRKATGNGIAIELNPAYQEPLRPYLEICRRHRAWISPGSNAHHLHEIGRAWTLLGQLWPPVTSPDPAAPP